MTQTRRLRRYTSGQLGPKLPGLGWSTPTSICQMASHLNCLPFSEPLRYGEKKLMADNEYKKEGHVVCRYNA